MWETMHRLRLLMCIGEKISLNNSEKIYKITEKYDIMNRYCIVSPLGE